MTQKLKGRKCKERKCRKEFSPKTRWQEFCSARCRYTFANRQNAAWIKKGKQAEEERDQQQGAA